GDQAVALEAGAVGPVNLAALEGTGFKVIADAGIHRELPRDFPGVLEEEAVDVVFRCHLAWAEGNRQAGWFLGKVHQILSEMELREERVPGVVADVETSLERMLVVDPGQIINVLITLLKSALGTAEVSAGGGAICVNDSRRGAVVREGADKPIEDKARFVGQ